MAIENRGPQVEAVAILFLTLSWIAVSLRCYVKLFMTKLFRIDDWLAVASLVSFTFFCAVVLAGARIGTGRHINDISKEDFSAAMMWWYCGEISYVLTTAFIKASIALFLLQICVYKYQKFTIWGVTILSTVFSIAYVMVMAFQCHPVSFFWMRFLGEPGQCIPATIIADMTYTHGAISTFSDWTLGILPIFLVWNLNMNPRTKVSVALILSLGALGSTASIVRFPYIYQLTETEDFLWSNTDVSIWSTVEPGIGLTAASMATMRPLFKAFLSRSRLFGSSAHGSAMLSNAPRLRCMRKTVEVQEIELRSKPSQGIHVTTTIVNTSQSKRSRRTEESTKSASDSDTALNGKSSWGTTLENESLEDVRQHTTVEAGGNV